MPKVNPKARAKNQAKIAALIPGFSPVKKRAKVVKKKQPWTGDKKPAPKVISFTNWDTNAYAPIKDKMSCLALIEQITKDGQHIAATNPTKLEEWRTDVINKYFRDKTGQLDFLLQKSYSLDTGKLHNSVTGTFRFAMKGITFRVAIFWFNNKIDSAKVLMQMKDHLPSKQAKDIFIPFVIAVFGEEISAKAFG